MKTENLNSKVRVVSVAQQADAQPRRRQTAFATRQPPFNGEQDVGVVADFSQVGFVGTRPPLSWPL